MKKTITVLNLSGYPDAQNQIIVKSGIVLPENKKVLVTRDFDPEELLCIADVEIKNNSIVATLDVDENNKDLFPAIGFNVLNSHQENGVFIIDEMKIQWIGLSERANVDASIKKISEQS